MGCLFGSGSFGGSLSGSSFLSCGSFFGCGCFFTGLVNNSLDSTCEGSHGSLEYHADACKELFLGGKLGKLVQLLERNKFAVKETCLNFEIVVGLCKLGKDLRSSNVILLAGGNSGSTVEDIAHACKCGSVDRYTDKSILGNAVFNACFSELLTKLGIISNRSTAVVNDYTCNSTLELFLKSCDLSLLFF